MTAAIHDQEFETGERVARALLATQGPAWNDARLRAVGEAGTQHALWRVDRPARPPVVLRLPRTPSAAASLPAERRLLDRLGDRPLPVAVPAVVAAGDGPAAEGLAAEGSAMEGSNGADPVFPHPWMVVGWLPGSDAWSARSELAPAPVEERLAVDLAETVLAIRARDDLDLPVRVVGDRGGPLTPLLARLDGWLDDPVWSADRLVDVAAVRRAMAETAEAADDPVEPSVVHGDLLPGNLLVGRPTDDPVAADEAAGSGEPGPRLTAVIDWGSAALADPAQDLSPAWAVLGPRGRQAFRERLDVDDATWLRGRAFELEHAVGAVLYYTPRRHPLAAMMGRALRELLDDGPDTGSRVRR